MWFDRAGMEPFVFGDTSRDYVVRTILPFPSLSQDDDDDDGGGDGGGGGGGC